MTQPDARYCHTCGRVIGARRANTAKASQAAVKYCSDKCKHQKPKSNPDSVELRIQYALIELLEGRSVKPPAVEDEEDEVPMVKAKYQPKKGDPRIIVQLSEVEEGVFGNRQDPEKTFGRRRNRAKRGVDEGPNWKSVDMVDGVATGVRHQAGDASQDEDDLTDGTDGSVNDDNHFQTNGVSIRIRPPQAKSDVNFSVGGERGWAEKIDETPEMEQKRLEGVKKAEEKEMVKQAARRAVVFGLPAPQSAKLGRKGGKDGKKNAKRAEPEPEEEDQQPVMRKCEALMNGAVVEPSFAKGDWSIRWRED